MIDIIAFDADDTLWHNEPLYADTTSRFRQMLGAYHSAEWIEQRLYETEIRNLRDYGYGIKSFTLSMIETAIELTEGRISAHEVQEILGFGKEMLHAPVKLMEGVEGTIRQLAEAYTLVVVTKGDILDQESKLARSGLGDLFSDIDVVTEKNRSTYHQVCERNGVAPSQLVMVGDSLRSDVLPAIDAGCHAIHVPCENQWQHEIVSDIATAGYEFRLARRIGEVPGLVAEIEASQF